MLFALDGACVELREVIDLNIVFRDVKSKLATVGPDVIAIDMPQKFFLELRTRAFDVANHRPAEMRHAEESLRRSFSRNAAQFQDGVLHANRAANDR